MEEEDLDRTAEMNDFYSEGCDLELMHEEEATFNVNWGEMQRHVRMITMRRLDAKLAQEENQTRKDRTLTATQKC